MQQAKLQEIIDLYNKKIKRLAALNAVVAVVALFAALASGSYGVLIAVILLLFPFAYLVPAILVSRLQKRYLMPILTEQLDPKGYYTARRATNSLDRFAVQDITVAFYLGDDAAVVDLCERMLGERRARRFRYYYLLMLAQIRYRHGETDELRALCDRFEREVSVDKNQDRIRAGYPAFAFFRMVLDNDSEGCLAYAQERYIPKETSTPLERVHMAYSHALLLYRLGRQDEARPLFACAAEQASGLYYATAATQYLNAIDNGVELVPSPLDMTDRTPTQPTVPIQGTKKARRSALALLILGVLLLLLGARLMWQDAPTDLVGAIEREDSLDELLAVAELDGSDDCLALYRSAKQELNVAYLIGDGKVGYTVEQRKEDVDPRMLYTFGIAEQDVRASFTLDAEGDAPDDAVSVIPFTAGGVAMTFTVRAVVHEDVRFNSFTTQIKP